MDEMRFGLISNYRRSWSKIGERTVISNQQEYTNRYLYSAIDPIKGCNFHLLGSDYADSITTKVFLRELQQEYKDYHLVVVWDNAPFHKKRELSQMDYITNIFLPSYSPELNPVERFFGEIRKSTANRHFKNIDIQEEMINKEIINFIKDKKKTKNLCGYQWILKQWKNIIF